MIITASRDLLCAALQRVTGVVDETRAIDSNTVLRNALLTMSDGTLSVLTTDTEIQIRVSLVANGNDGSICLNAKRLYDILRNLPKETQLQLEQTEDKSSVTLTCEHKDSTEKNTYHLVPYDTEETPFPELVVPEHNYSITFLSSVFSRMLRKTSYAMATQDVRYFLRSLLLEIDTEGFRLVGTNGHRLSRDEETLTTTVSEKHQLILPRKAVTELAKLFAGEETSVELRWTDNFFEVEMGEVRFSSRLVDGAYPDHNSVIPRTAKTPVRLHRKEFLQQLDRAGTILDPSDMQVVLLFDGSRMSASCKNSLNESSLAEMAVEYSGDKMEVGFNLIYLREALLAMTSEYVALSMEDKKSSCLLLPEEDEAGDQYVIMPLNI